MIINPFDTPVDATGREQVVHGSADFPIACYFNDLVQFPVMMHWHEELEAGIVTEGTAVISFGSEKHTLRSGEGFFINSGVLHDACPLDGRGCQIHSMVFHPRLVSGSTDSVFHRRYLRPLLEDPTLDHILFLRSDADDQEALKAIDSAWNALRTESPGYEFAARSALSKLIWKLHNLQPDRKSNPGSKSLRDSERIKLMLSYIHQHYSHTISTKSIAAAASVSESECLRCFRSTIGTTPIQYLKQHRLRQAAMQLLGTSDKISEIAEQCGFQDMSYFTKSFREAEGCSPSDYRKMHTE